MCRGAEVGRGQMGKGWCVNIFLSFIHLAINKVLSFVQLFVTLWTVVCQASLSLGFSKQEYWSGLPFPSPWDLPDSGIEPGSPALEADALTSESPGKPQEALYMCIYSFSYVLYSFPLCFITGY